MSQDTGQDTEKELKMLSMDLELNRSSDLENEGATTDIIEIGACVLNLKTLAVEAKFRRYIKLSTPMDSGDLRVSKFITKLTGIDDAKLEEEGIELARAVRDLYEFCKQEGVMRQGLQWGHGDFEGLKSEYLEKGGDPAFWYFGRTHYDAKKLHQSIQLARGQKTRSGLSKSMTKHGLRFEGAKHRALDDAVNTARIYALFLEKIRKAGV